MSVISYISSEQDQLQEMKAKTNMEGKYIKKCAEVSVAQTQKKCSLSEKEMKDQIEVCHSEWGCTLTWVLFSSVKLVDSSFLQVTGQCWQILSSQQITWPVKLVRESGCDFTRSWVISPSPYHSCLHMHKYPHTFILVLKSCSICDPV